MYLDHFGLKEPPFRITPHTDFFFQGANRGATLEALLYAITHDEGIVKVSGEVGSGKTMLCRVLMERLPATVETIYLANPSLSRDEILFAIGDELKMGLEKDATTRVLRGIAITSRPRTSNRSKPPTQRPVLRGGAYSVSTQRSAHSLDHNRSPKAGNPEKETDDENAHTARRIFEFGETARRAPMSSSSAGRAQDDPHHRRAAGA